MNTPEGVAKPHNEEMPEQTHSSELIKNISDGSDKYSQEFLNFPLNLTEADINCLLNEVAEREQIENFKFFEKNWNFVIKRFPQMTLPILAFVQQTITEMSRNSGSRSYIAEMTQFLKKRTCSISVELIDGVLTPVKWFRDTPAGPKFHPHDCASDYLAVFAHTVTEYGGPTHQWTGTYWLKDAEEYIKAKIEAEAVLTPAQIDAAFISLQNITRVTDAAKMRLTMEDIMPLPAHTVPITDGLLNLKTKQISPHAPEYYYTEALPRKYILGATPTKFLELLNIMFKGDSDKELKITQIFETFAWTLIKNYDIQGMVVMQGEGGEGKSIILTVIGNVVVNTSAVTLHELENDPFSKPDLYGSWANLISESTAKAIGSEWFKRLTDGTEIRAARKHGQPFKFKPHAKMIAGVNELPEKREETRAFYRRIIAIIKFNNRLEDLLTPIEIGQFVKDLQDPSELDKIFSYVADNYYAPLVERMKFTGQLSTNEVEQVWEQYSNAALTFIKTKQENKLIYTDVENARSEIMSRKDLKIEDWITTEKTGDEYLATLKNPLIQEGIKWAKNKKFPAKHIDAKTIGAALTSLEYDNITVNKRVGKGVTLRVWKNIAILPFDPENDDGIFKIDEGCDGSSQNYPSHQKTLTEPDPVSDVTDPLPNVGPILTNQKDKEKYQNTRHRSIAQSPTAEENAVTDGSVGSPFIRHTEEPKSVNSSTPSSVQNENLGFKSVQVVLRDLNMWNFEVLEYMKAYDGNEWKAKLKGKFSGFTTEQQQYLGKMYRVMFEGSDSSPHVWVKFKIRDSDSQ